ncbi:MAG: PAS domain-containing protein, partial [Myxococcales bacterium]|nr:PAS domain-containing protein [Myxococcales bacterium]
MQSDTPGEFRGLLEDDDFVRSLVNSLFAFVAVLDPDGPVLDVNLPALRVADLSASDVRGKLFWDCYWWSFSDAVAREVQNDCLEASRGQTIRRDAVVRITGDGRMMVDFQITPARDARGNIAYLIASGVDVTTTRQAEEALRRSDEKEAILLRLMRVQKEATDPETIMAEAVRAVGQKFKVNRVGFWEMRDENTLAFGECWT